MLDSNDREVIEACQRGDSDAFRLLFETHKDRVYSIALRYSGDRAAAMDIAQESFLKVLGSIHEFRREAVFVSWLYRIVVNTCLDYQRRGRRHNAVPGRTDGRGAGAGRDRAAWSVAPRNRG